VRTISILLASLVICASAAHAADYCSRDPRVEAVDLSAPVNQSFLDQMQAIGINTIIRYYDHEKRNPAGKKLLRKAERDLILTNGFKTAVVFQHRNDQFASFTALRGRQDAERSLALAAENSQPKGSAIYFGVDGAWKTPYELANIVSYFNEVNGRLAGKRLSCWGLRQRPRMQHAARKRARRTMLARIPDPPGRITSTTTGQSSGDWFSYPLRGAAAEASILTCPTASAPTTASLGIEGAAGR